LELISKFASSPLTKTSKTSIQEFSVLMAETQKSGMKHQGEDAKDHSQTAIDNPCSSDERQCKQ